MLKRIVDKGGCTEMKKMYEKPTIESEAAVESLAGGCTLFSENDEACASDFGGTVQNTAS